MLKLTGDEVVGRQLLIMLAEYLLVNYESDLRVPVHRSSSLNLLSRSKHCSIPWMYLLFPLLIQMALNRASRSSLKDDSFPVASEIMRIMWTWIGTFLINSALHKKDTYINEKLSWLCRGWKGVAYFLPSFFFAHLWRKRFALSGNFHGGEVCVNYPFDAGFLNILFIDPNYQVTAKHVILRIMTC